MNLNKMYTAKELRNNDNHLLRRLERQQMEYRNNSNKVSEKINYGFDLHKILKNFKQDLKKEQKSKFKDNLFFEQTITKIGIRSKKR